MPFCDQSRHFDSQVCISIISERKSHPPFSYLKINLNSCNQILWGEHWYFEPLSPHVIGESMALRTTTPSYYNSI